MSTTQAGDVDPGSSCCGPGVGSVVRGGLDRSSFAAVFEAQHRRAVRLAYLLTSDRDLAEDIVAEAFAKVFVPWQRGEVQDVESYLRRAVVNEANSKLRRRYLERREAARQTADDRGQLPPEDHTLDRDEMWVALQQLPDRQRRAIVLRYYEDLSEAQTAALLGVSVGTVKSQVSRGLARLQRLLGEPATVGAEHEDGRQSTRARNGCGPACVRTTTRWDRRKSCGAEPTGASIGARDGARSDGHSRVSPARLPRCSRGGRARTRA